MNFFLLNIFEIIPGKEMDRGVEVHITNSNSLFKAILAEKIANLRKSNDLFKNVSLLEYFKSYSTINIPSTLPVRIPLTNSPTKPVFPLWSCAQTTVTW